MSNVTVYVMTVWRNLPTKTSAIDQTNLNHIEQGIKNVTDFINTLNATSGLYLSQTPFTTALKNKLDGIEAQANKYVLPTASNSTLGGVKVDAETITIDQNGVIHAAAAATQLSALTDVNLEDLTDGQILKYDSDTGKWVNTSEAEVRTQLSLLEDVDINDPQDGETLKYNATTEKWENGESGDVLGYEETLEVLGLPPNPVYLIQLATPIMTGMNTPSGVVTQSGKQPSNSDAWVMFQQNNNYTSDSAQTWAASSAPQWVGYEFPFPKRIVKLDIYNRSVSGQTVLACKTIVFQGSIDGTNWTDLSTLNKLQSSMGAKETFEIENDDAYKYYRFYITEGYDSNYVSIGCINMYEKILV